MNEKHILEELKNICQNEPLWPGDTISHQGANGCIGRGWARRNDDGDIISTAKGRARNKL